MARYLRDNWVLYLFVLPTVLYFVIFHYWPMYGATIAFKNFTPVKGILGSPGPGSPTSNGSSIPTSSSC